jgi:hypothetical protein
MSMVQELSSHPPHQLLDIAGGKINYSDSLELKW